MRPPAPPTAGRRWHLPSVVVMLCTAAKNVVRQLYGFVGLKVENSVSLRKNCGTPRALCQRGISPQAARHFGRWPAVMQDIALRALSLRDSKWLPCNNYKLCIMNYALEKAHGCVPITATRF